MAAENIIRPVGRLEKCSTARHSLGGLYRSVILTGRYRYNGGLRDLELTFLEALSNLVLRHPALCCSARDEETSNPSVVRLESICLRDVVKFSDYSPKDNSSDKEPLCRQLEDQHDRLWNNLPRLPGWRLVISKLRQGDSTNGGEPPLFLLLDVLFVFHHALADGLSGVAFHRSLLQELRVVSQRSFSEMKRNIDTVQVPRMIDLCEPIEKLTKFPLSWRYLCRQVLHNFAPTWISGRNSEYWSGAACSSSGEVARVCVRRISVAPEQLGSLLHKCRTQKVTLTCLITAVLVASLAQLVPDAKSLVGSTAHTLRRVIGTSMDEIVNQTSSFESHYSQALLDSVRRKPSWSSSCEEAKDERSENFWKIARHFHYDMKTELAKEPQDNLLGLLPLIGDYHDFYRKKLGQKRDHSFEVSNVGVLKITNNSAIPIPPNQVIKPSHQDDQRPSWDIDSMTFTQGVQVTGAALALNCASVYGGPLMLTLTWQEGILEEAFAEALVRELDTLLGRIAEDTEV